MSTDQEREDPRYIEALRIANQRRIHNNEVAAIADRRLDREVGSYAAVSCDVLCLDGYFDVESLLAAAAILKEYLEHKQ
jgi:hypothetical protein